MFGRAVINQHAMNVYATRYDSVLVAEISGRIDGMNAADFEKALSDCMSDSDTAVILDLSALNYISSAGLRSILLTAKNLSKQDAKFKLCEVPDPILEIIKIAGFDRIIDVVDTRDNALDSV